HVDQQQQQQYGAYYNQGSYPPQQQQNNTGYPPQQQQQQQQYQQPPPMNNAPPMSNPTTNSVPQQQVSPQSYPPQNQSGSQGQTNTGYPMYYQPQNQSGSQGQTSQPTQTSSQPPMNNPSINAPPPFNPYQPPQQQQQQPYGNQQGGSYPPSTQNPMGYGQQQPYNPQQQQSNQPYNPQQQQQQQYMQPNQQQPYNPQQQQWNQQQNQQLPNLQNLSLNPNQNQTYQNLPSVMPNQPWQPTPNAQADDRINISKIPSPTVVLDQFNSFIYRTNEAGVPPPSSVQQLCVDIENSSPNFIRSTIYTIPESQDTLNLTYIPFAIHTQPLATLNPGEDEVPIIRHPGGPVQCKRCHAYINPFNLFTNAGKYFTCKFCEFDNNVSQEYFSAILPNGKRTDFEQRPELQRGTYEFVKSESDPKCIPGYIFVIEVSAFTVKNGILNVIISSIKKILNEMYDKLPPKIGIVTYDTEVHFWGFKKNYNQPQMKVLSKNSVFVPFDDGFLVDYKESKSQVDYFLDNINTFFLYPKTSDREFAFGAAVQSASLALEKCGGRIFSFVSHFSKASPGNIEKRVEKTLVPAPQASANFYKPVANQCVKMNVSIDLFVVPNEIVDLPTIGQLSTITGGHISCYSNYSPLIHSEQLESDILHFVTMNFGFNATAKVRCSRGITVNGHFGNFTEVNNEVQFSGISSDKSLTTMLKYDDKLKSKSKAYIQFAMIYTNILGETRIRIHNLRINVDSVLANFFKDSDLDSIITFYARIASKEVVSVTPSVVRTNTVDRGVDVLASYRKNCASDKKPTQLILPESVKLMPIYILSMMKTPTFRLSPDISPDLRFYYLNLFTSAPPCRIIPLIYPRLYPIHNLSAEVGFKHPTFNHIVLPNFIRLASDQVAQSGIYIFEDGISIIVWIQQFTATNFIRDLFGVESVSGLVSSKLAELYNANRGANEYHQRIDAIIQSISAQRGYKNGRPIQFATYNDPIDSQLKLQFYEDKGVDSVTYADFLCQVHKQIQNKLSFSDYQQTAAAMLMANSY
ncbi:hypothetical protein CYY_010132, partial [Polysphondylium violaceum]